MNVNNLVIEALRPCNLPVSPDFYDGDDDEYITFNYANEYPTNFGDNVPENDYSQLQIHYFARGKNPQSKRREIRKLLFKAGFDVSLGPINYESDTKKYHCVLEAGIDSVTNLEE